MPMKPPRTGRDTSLSASTEGCEQNHSGQTLRVFVTVPLMSLSSMWPSQSCHLCPSPSTRCRRCARQPGGRAAGMPEWGAKEGSQTPLTSPASVPTPPHTSHPSESTSSPSRNSWSPWQWRRQSRRGPPSPGPAFSGGPPDRGPRGCRGVWQGRTQGVLCPGVDVACGRGCDGPLCWSSCRRSLRSRERGCPSSWQLTLSTCTLCSLCSLSRPPPPSVPSQALPGHYPKDQLASFIAAEAGAEWGAGWAHCQAGG